MAPHGSAAPAPTPLRRRRRSASQAEPSRRPAQPAATAGRPPTTTMRAWTAAVLCLAALTLCARLPRCPGLDDGGYSYDGGGGGFPAEEEEVQQQQDEQDKADAIDYKDPCKAGKRRCRRAWRQLSSAHLLGPPRLRRRKNLGGGLVNVKDNYGKDDLRPTHPAIGLWNLLPAMARRGGGLGSQLAPAWHHCLVPLLSSSLAASPNQGS